MKSFIQGVSNLVNSIMLGGVEGEGGPDVVFTARKVSLKIYRDTFNATTMYYCYIIEDGNSEN